ncbi:MAG: hypothetical protein ABI939_05780 [Anaerolineaceae bacterium]
MQEFQLVVAQRAVAEVLELLFRAANIKRFRFLDQGTDDERLFAGIEPLTNKFVSGIALVGLTTPKTTGAPGQ